MSTKRMKNVCIIDDDPIFVFGTKKMMEHVNFSERIIVYQDGQEALDSLSLLASQIDLFPEVIFLDLNMPIMDGWQFLDEFIKIIPPRPTTIYVVSSSVDPNDTEKVKNYDIVNDYIVKPMGVNELHSVLAKMD